MERNYNGIVKNVQRPVTRTLLAVRLFATSSLVDPDACAGSRKPELYPNVSYNLSKVWPKFLNNEIA